MCRNTPIFCAAGLLIGAMLAQVRQPHPLPPDISKIVFRDPAQIDSKHYAVELENEQVRVLRVKLGPDETVPLHDARTGLLVAVSESHVRFIRPDKRMYYVDLDPGGVQWIYEDTYSDKNISNKPAEFLFIEMNSPRSR